MSKQQTKKTIKKHCDQLWSMIVRFPGRCEICGSSTKQLHAHHLISRERIHYRYDLSNGVCLCATCHEFSNDCAAHSSNTAGVENFIEWLKGSEHGQWWNDNKTQRPLETYNLAWYQQQKDYLMKVLADKLGYKGKHTLSGLRKAFRDRDNVYGY